MNIKQMKIAALWAIVCHGTLTSATDRRTSNLFGDDNGEHVISSHKSLPGQNVGVDINIIERDRRDAVCHMLSPSKFVTMTFTNMRMKLRHMKSYPSDWEGPCVDHCEELCPKGIEFSSDMECTCSLLGGDGPPSPGSAPTTPRPTLLKPTLSNDKTTAICHKLSPTSFVTKTFPNKRKKVQHLEANPSDRDGPCMDNPKAPTPRPTRNRGKGKGRRQKIQICHNEITPMKTPRFVTQVIRKSRLIRHMRKNPNDMEGPCSDFCDELCPMDNLISDDCNCTDTTGDGTELAPPAPATTSPMPTGGDLVGPDGGDLAGRDGGVDPGGRGAGPGNKPRPRKGKLGRLSPHTLDLDCARNIELKLFEDDDDSESLTFKPDLVACRTGKAFAGKAANGRPYTLNLVRSKHGTRRTFAASVNNFETGEVTAVRADANGVMHSTTYAPENFDPEDYEDDNDNSGIVFTRDLSDQAVRNELGSDGKLHRRMGRIEERNLQGNTQDITQVDILVAWTPDAECKESKEDFGCVRTDTTEANMRTLIDLAIEESNVAFEQSGVKMELNLVHAAYTEYSESDSKPTSKALDHLQNNADGYMDEIHELRVQYGADVVSLITGKRELCGKADPNGPAPDRMFSVTQHKCAAGKYTFAHEIAHNFGCRHDRGSQNHCENQASNYGYRDPGANFVTILGYECNKNNVCPGSLTDNGNGKDCMARIQYFSNPDHTFDGKPMGSERDNNVAWLNSVKDEVAAYFNAPGSTAEPTSSPVTPDPTVPPSKEPTNTPTKEPTSSPVTPDPTASPSTEPTNLPTNTPTTDPTSSPVTPNPTVPPSKEPTNEPTASLSTSPSHYPSVFTQPTMSPTITESPTSLASE